MLANARRYIAATAGPALAAAAQLLLTLVLFRDLPVRDFGIFSLLLLMAQLGLGIWSALFCAPLPAVAAEPDAVAREPMLQALYAANFAGAVAAASILGLIAWALASSPATATLFALFGGVSLLRWFARAQSYVKREPGRTISSDLIYGGLLTLGSLAFFVAVRATTELAFALLMASTAIALLPFGATALRRQLGFRSLQGMAAYRMIWRKHSSWSLLGVVTTEATANSHAYLVTALLGPAAFAPLAASNVVIRPINVVTNALGEWERPRMARTHQEGRLRDLEASRRSYRWTLLLFWLATLVGGTALLLLVPSNHWLPPQYDSQFLIVAAGLWMLVALARLLRAPESTVLQALGSFRPLALATIYSAPVSVLAVLLSLAFGSVLWSIAGVLVGEILCCLLVWRAHARFRHLEADRPVHPMGVARL